MLNFKRHKAAVLLAAMFALAFMMCGCSQNASAGVGAGEFISCLKQNCIVAETVEMENFNENAPETYLYTKLHILGLKDSGTEDKINKAIEGKYSELMSDGLPAYRGISSVIDTSVKKSSETISMNVMGNFNDILSVLILKTVNQGGIHYIDCHTLNFDLNTGEQIGIGSLIQSEEGMDALNKLAAEDIDVIGKNYYGGDFYDPSQEYLMVGAFKGVKEDQKFYLSDNKIHLVFDYTNPEFYMTAFAPYEVAVGYDRIYEHLNLAAYLSSGDLYSESEEKYLLVYGSDEAVEAQLDVPQGSANVHFGMSCTYPPDAPDNIKAEAEKLSVFNSDLASQLKSEAASNAAYQYGYTNTVRVNRIGNYYNLIHSESYYKANYWGESSTGYVYDLSGKEVKLSSLFKAGADHETVIKDFIAEKLSYDFPDGDYGGKTLDEIYDEITFSLDTYGLQIKTQPIKFTMDLGETDYESSLSIFIPYDEFGCDQMTIFN